LDRAGPEMLRGACGAVPLHLHDERGAGKSTRDLQIFRVAYHPGETRYLDEGQGGGTMIPPLETERMWARPVRLETPDRERD
jgi:hypothetical protein